jgi:C4-dicarboxylate transporter DctM subunit
VHVEPFKLGKPITGFTWKERFESIPGTFPIFIVVGIIFSAMYTGSATPTEAGALGAFVVFLYYCWRAFRENELNKMSAGSRKR